MMLKPEDLPVSMPLSPTWNREVCDKIWINHNIFANLPRLFGKVFNFPKKLKQLS